MAILPADLLSPEGPVEWDFFPGEDIDGDVEGVTLLEERLTAYINQARAKNALIAFEDADAADTALALYLTFSAAYRLMIARPSDEASMIPGIGSQGYDKDQRDAVKALATQYDNEYSLLLAAVPTTQSPQGAQSRQTALEYDW